MQRRVPISRVQPCKRRSRELSGSGRGTEPTSPRERKATSSRPRKDSTLRVRSSRRPSDEQLPCGQRSRRQRQDGTRRTVSGAALRSRALPCDSTPKADGSQALPRTHSERTQTRRGKPAVSPLTCPLRSEHGARRGPGRSAAKPLGPHVAPPPPSHPRPRPGRTRADLWPPARLPPETWRCLRREGAGGARRCTALLPPRRPPPPLPQGRARPAQPPRFPRPAGPGAARRELGGSSAARGSRQGGLRRRGLWRGGGFSGRTLPAERGRGAASSAGPPCGARSCRAGRGRARLTCAS